MRLLTPLGLIALIGLLILLLIYLIKPTYQNKLLSTTYIWRESLKYKKGERPTSKLRNILLIIVQILIISVISFILATPFVNAKSDDKTEQNIVIIDSSANMLLDSDNGTRLSRAVAAAKELIKKEVKAGRSISLINCDGDSDVLITKSLDCNELTSKLDSIEASYSRADLDGALGLANEIIQTNSLAKVYLYTGTDYKNIGDVEVVNVSNEGEWNAGILDVKAELKDNFYEITVEVGVYGADKYVNVSVSVNDANTSLNVERGDKRINASSNKPVKVKFSDLDVYSYSSIDVRISMDDGSEDGFKYDDTFTLFGGAKENIKIQYASSRKNNFFSGALMVLRNSFSDYWNIDIKEVDKLKEAATSGFDLYIYEHTMPTKVPTDGVILLVNPDDMPRNVNLTLLDKRDGDFVMANGFNHPIMNGIKASDITATTYKPIQLTDGYNSLINCNGDSVFAVNDSLRTAVLTLDLNRSNLPLLFQFPLMVTNIFEYFNPKTINGRVFNVDDAINVNTRGLELKLSDGNTETALEVPSTISIAKPGRYKLLQKLSNGSSNVDFYVRIAKEESNVNKGTVNLDGQFEIKRPDNVMDDIYLYLAISLVALLFIERFLYSKENI